MGWLGNSAGQAAEQLVEAGESGVRPGWGLQRLTTIGEVDVVSAIRPHLEWLFEQTRETVDLSMGQGQEVVFLDWIVSDQPLRVVPITERPHAIQLMANGKAVLSAMSDENVKKLFDEKRRRPKGAPEVNLAALLAELAAIRKSGFAFDRAGYADDVYAIGTPVHIGGLRPYALSIGAPSCRFEAGLAKFKSALKECRRRAEAELTHIGRD